MLFIAWIMFGGWLSSSIRFYPRPLALRMPRDNSVRFIPLKIHFAAGVVLHIDESRLSGDIRRSTKKMIRRSRRATSKAGKGGFNKINKLWSSHGAQNF